MSAAETAGALAELSPREVRALTESMAVVTRGGFADAPGCYEVYNEEGNACYRVDVRDGSYTCPDAAYNLPEGEPCKHQLRVAYVAGACDLPAGVPEERIDYVLRSQRERFAERHGDDADEEQEEGR